MSAKLVSTIGDQIEALENLGFTPATIVLSIMEYQALMAHVAAKAGLDHMDALQEFLGCAVVAISTPDVVEVVPDVREMWERGEEFGPKTAPPAAAEQWGDVI